MEEALNNQVDKMTQPVDFSPWTLQYWWYELHAMVAGMEAIHRPTAWLLSPRPICHCWMTNSLATETNIELLIWHHPLWRPTNHFVASDYVRPLSYWEEQQFILTESTCTPDTRLPFLPKGICQHCYHRAYWHSIQIIGPRNSVIDKEVWHNDRGICWPYCILYHPEVTGCDEITSYQPLRIQLREDKQGGWAPSFRVQYTFYINNCHLGLCPSWIASVSLGTEE